MVEELAAPNVAHADPPRYSFWVGVAFTINYVIGSGFLTIPWAFQQAGPLLGLLVLFVFAFFSVVSVLFILETMERAELLYLSGKEEELRSIKKEEQEQSWVSSTFRSLSYLSLPDSSTHHGSERADDGAGETVYNSIFDWVRGGASIEMSKQPGEVADEEGIAADIHVRDEGSLDLPVDRCNDPGGSPRRTDPDSDGVVNNTNTSPENRRIEIIEMCDLFLNPLFHYLFAFCVIVYLYGTCWAYCTVFANAFGAQLNIGPLSYMIYLFVFFVLVTPFSLMELSEQIYVQVTLAFLRVVMVLIMIVTTMAAYASRREDFGDLSNIGDQPMGEHILEFHFDKIYLLLPIAAYAYIFHHSVPALSEPITDKKSLGKLFITAMMIAALSYSTLGLCVSLYFGQNTMSSSNLNWEAFIGLRPHGSTPLYAQVISFFVVLFPAVDVVSGSSFLFSSFAPRAYDIFIVLFFYSLIFEI